MHKRNPCSAVADVLDCHFEISEFKHQSKYYVYIRTNNQGKDVSPHIPPVMR